MELFRINAAIIRKFQEKYTDKFRTRDLALGELKALLNQAHRDDLLKSVPKFEPIPRAKQRSEIIPFELAVKTVEVITKQIFRDMYAMMLEYPIRPSEIRALTWKNVDLNSGFFVINQHFSGSEVIKGRKSIKEGKKQASLKFNISKEAREILLRHRNASLVSLSSFVFLSNQGNAVSGDSLWEAWKFAREKIGHNYAPYECRHASASALYVKTGRDMLRTKEVGGWTSTNTLEIYARDQSDNSDLFQ